MQVSANVCKISSSFAQTGEAHAYQSGLSLRVEINDPGLKAGFENVFTLVPTANGWKRFDLHYGRGLNYWESPRDNQWTLNVSPGALDANLLRQHGIAFGIEMDGKTTWCQTPDDNFGVQIL